MTGSLLGNAVRRVEDPNLLTGRGRYVDDLPIEGALHAHFVRSPIAHGRVVSIDASEALTMPGVVAVYTAADLGLARVFPTPERLIGEPISLVLNMPRARGAAIEALARTVAEDPAIFTPRADLDSAISALKALPGVGEWTAQYIALRELREPDAFPGADIGLLRAMADEEGVRPTADRLLARSEAWRPWRAYAAQHLWAADPALTQSKTSPKTKPKDKTDARRAA